MKIRPAFVLGLVSSTLIASASATPPRSVARPSAVQALKSLLAVDIVDLKFRALRRDAKGNILESMNTEPVLWSQKDLKKNKVPGTSTERAYSELGLQAPKEPVIVAVLDSGVDIAHPDLAGMIWTNEAEKNGKPGVDDDGNGYVDDVHGWNFIGNLTGQTIELTRELRRYRQLKADGKLDTAGEKVLAELEAAFSVEHDGLVETRERYTEFATQYAAALEILKKAGVKAETVEAITAFVPNGQEQTLAKTAVLRFLSQGVDSAKFAEYLAYFQSKLDFHLNVNFDGDAIIGDHPEDLNEKGYGNPDVFGPREKATADHGTHCSGIIAALRGNGEGMDGQTNFVRIMPIRAVPDGDERDKDVANGIRYAVDNGAKIISMSFGKAYSPHKEIVDAAVAYAESKGVLLVHAAGNDSQNIDEVKNYPNAKLGKEGRKATNWLEIGASTIVDGATLPASFSNYSPQSVDLFAPGHEIYSTIPDGKYASFSGTSMATPEVAGVAAILVSQKSDLSVVDLRDLLIRGVTPMGDRAVFVPGYDEAAPEGEKVPFSTLSVTGGVANARRSLKLLTGTTNQENTLAF